MKKIIGHFVVVVGILFLFLGIPLLLSDGFFAKMRGEEVDVTSSATSVIEQPSGAYTVLINKEKRRDEKTLSDWCDFFEGKEIPVIFEDINCSVLSNDPAGLEMARSFQSRLPENQMTLSSEDGVLILSKAEFGRFDVILISEEMASSMHVENLYSDSKVQVIKGRNGGQS